ncbi:PGAP1-like protein [Fibrobacter sp. UWB15]|uniref:LamG-like jellyroll fold domain-containing protein n=1 Tax=unclassified Fibrobacter TaxID=2634177 RepID=UPI00091E2DC8|nr:MULTISPECIES: LamG-like jellyroll fold domain-containing protein [unclassified Fibrobacter]PWJ63122.1 PGAP1-like protein [Fibrobacter sp. UWB6]SHG40568.1 PGAP1-like protein [Fibrobacter sp. UWB8]SMG37802.1 PGAP1-like protein [Fibrobacter sp. UWB15]
MKRLIVCLLLMAFTAISWAVPKPMEAITNYNVLMVHGAYGSDKGIDEDKNLKEADSTSEYLGDATLGSYTSDNRITKWIGSKIFEEPDIGDERNPSNAYIYNWRSFTNPANSSLNNAHEMGDRMWNAKTNGNLKFGKRRALFEEAQEVKARFAVDENDSTKDLHGQTALDSIRKYPDLYRQLASRYILIGHSMGGVVSREYVQGNFYNGDVDKIITLDSPHEGTGALNMQLKKGIRIDNFTEQIVKDFYKAIPAAVVVAVPCFLVKGSAPAFKIAMSMLGATFAIEKIGNGLTQVNAPEYYYPDDSLVYYVDPLNDGYQTIDSLNKLSFKNKIDSLPMFRILASKHGMTFTDPDLIDYGLFEFIRYLFPDNFTLPLANFGSQLMGTGDISARNANAITSAIMGFAGIPVQDNGSSIVPATSSEGKNVDILNDKEVDVNRSYFNAAPATSSDVGDAAFILETSADAILLIDYTVGLLFPTSAEIAKMALGTASAILIANSMALSLKSGISDLTNSHQIPLYASNLDTMQSAENFFAPIQSGTSSYTPYLMEDFLYERPFVNLALNDTATLNQLQGMSDSARDVSTLNHNCYYIASGDTAKDAVVKKTTSCAVGLFKSSNDLTSTHKNQSLSGLTTPLRFKSESDWSKMGVKVDRWEKVDGLTPEGKDTSDYVPIRHVERYEVPAITVEDWINKYSFVVDDLMPHRLRQIRMNFNFVTEIAWECDITKAEDDEKACKVYQRSAGESWGKSKKTVRHPVKKNGQFDFIPDDYGITNKLAIQKDNQNTVTISTVNKIGLSNTQRFYYMYKATEDLLGSNWPTRDVVLNSVEGFEAHASVLNYQGFRVDSAYDVVYKGDDIEHGTRLKMTGTPNGEQDMDFESRQQMDKLSDGQYTWQFRAYAYNSLEKALDTSKFYNASFTIDRIPPKFSLYTDNGFVNPDSASFVVRYKWDGGDSKTPDIRAMRWNLDTACVLAHGDSAISKAVCSGSISLPAMYDAAARNFAISWDEISADTRRNLADGLYRIKAYALDYAVPNRAMYDSVNVLVNKIMGSPKSLTDADWKCVRDSSARLNDTTVYAMFRIDRTAPIVSQIEPRATFAVDTTGTSFATGIILANPYASLSRPVRDSRFTYVADDSLLKISYKIKELHPDQDSALALVSWNFEHVGDSAKVSRAGDSVWVKEDLATKSWIEPSGLRLADGIYKIRANVRDRAGNVSDSTAMKMVRVDRTAPNIVSLVSRRLVYPDDDNAFSATIRVNQSYDADSNKTGMYCHYRVSGGDADRTWRVISRNGKDSLLKSDSVSFALDSTAVGTEKGKRYLEVACIDAAGNASVRTDLFHIGFRSPNIVYPVANKTESSERLIPIVGIAPPLSSSDSLTAVYRLRYKKCADKEWLGDKIDVVASNRQQKDSLHNYSRISQSTEGVLGYLKNEGFDEDSVCIELAVSSCLTCDDWKADVSKVIVTPPEDSGAVNHPTVVFNVSKQSFTAGDDSVSVTLHLEGAFNSSYQLRVYAEDKKGVGLKDWAAQKVWRNPYYGIPSDSLVNATSSGVWFYQDSAGTYHLRWKNIGDTLGLQVMYDSKKMGQTCAKPEGKNMESGCEIESMLFDFTSASIVKTYLEDYPEWIPPSYTDSVMKLSVQSGHIVLNAQAAFRIALDRGYVVDTNRVNIPVYFGNSLESGFYWVNGLEERYMSPLTTGWTADPQGYGLNFVWNGLAETGAFPAEGPVRLVAEVTENTTKAPHVHVETKVINVELPVLKVVLPNTVPDFLILNKNIDNGDSVAYRLDSMEIRYGIKNRDACVWMYIKDSKGTFATSLLDSIPHRAFASDSAYSIRWSGKNAFDVPENADGLYTVVLKAKSFIGSDSGKDSVQTDSTEMTFNVKYAESMLKMTPEDPKNSTSPSIYVSEAKKDPYSGDKYRYEPVADYLLRTNLSGWYLPDSLRDSLNVKTAVTGKQKPLGFEAERFSLGILRQRDTLDLVVLIDFDEKLDKNGCDSGKPTYDGESHHAYRKKFIRFYKGKTELDTLFFSANVGSIDDGRAFSIHENSVLKVYAFPAYMKDSSVEALASNVRQAFAWFNYTMPIPTRNHENDIAVKWGAWNKLPDGCIADSLHDCTYKSEGYNSEANLFMLEIVPQSIKCESIRKYSYPKVVWTMDWADIGLEQCPIHKTYFYHNLGQVRNGESCYNNDRGFEQISFTLQIGIPNFYWNAGFGYDNLVNRTIRFDATNGTIYGDTSGYLLAIEKTQGLSKDPRRNNYYDGTKWTFNKKYGRVTAFETQHLPFFKASEMDIKENIFLFPDEIKNYEKPSRFTFKFYDKDTLSHFIADVIAKEENGTPYHNWVTSLKNGILSTDMLKHGDMDVFVSYNKVVAETDKFFNDTTGYWITFPLAKDSIPESNDTVKYYAAASKIHYYVNDYNSSKWKRVFSRGTYFKNLANSAGFVNLLDVNLDVDPNSIKELGLIDSLITKNDSGNVIISLDSRKYDESSRRYYAALGKAPRSEAGLQYYLNYVLDGLDTSLYSQSNDTLYVKAQRWNAHKYIRRIEKKMEIPKRTKPVRVGMDVIYEPNQWQKEVVIDSAYLMFLDSSEHSHFEAAGNFPAASDFVIKYKDKVGEKRIPEYVELRAKLKEKTKYSLAYMNGNTFYSVPKSMLDSVWRDSIWTDSSGDYRLGWFNVNKLQGNTQFLLTWGNSQNGKAYYYSTFDLIVGGAVAKGASRTVISPLEDASVTFFDNSLTENKDITVRTVDADNSFDVFNNLALNGPIVEVLPSMTFADTTALPRIQMKISREEMVAMNATPQTVKLYKVDFANKQFVPLESALYGFLNADGSAVMDGTDTLKCNNANKTTDTRCAGEDPQWAYLLISAETKTFSVFTAMDSAIAETPNFSVTVLPEIAAAVNRTVRVDGISRFRLYVDDDSLLANRDDVTPPDTLAFTADSNGFAHVTLPSRNNNIDTSYVFVVALSEPDSNGSVVELPAAPAVARALTVNTQFACTVPSDSLWLGLDNGYMAYGASCTHPGYGLVSLYRDGRVVAEIRGEIPDTVIYDGSKTTGASSLGKISTGVYESRYVGVSALGMDMQMAGPRIHTDSARPAIRNFSVQDSSEVLDRIFTATADVYDSESGVARVVVTPVFGGDTLRVMNVVPDSAGHVSASIRISRKQLAECTGCYLSMEVRVEDYGHNHAEQKHVSEKLYPYPTELALWYPAREGGGRLVHELLGTGHDLDLFKKMGGPWGSDAGLYFSKSTDYIYGNGTVDFGSTNSYSFEARIKPGNPNDNAWHEILSFKGVNALDIRLLQNKRALMLVECSHNWKTGSILPITNKSWSHVVVTVDSDSVKFYVDGESKAARNSGISLEREMEGVFSMGKAGSEPSYIGNIADIRMYSRALTAAEVEELSKPVTDAGEVSDVIVIAVKDMEAMSGFLNEFSCSVAGNKYLVSGDSATLAMSVIVENAADYNVVLYARSATAGDKPVYVGESSLLAGTAAVSNTWRAVTVSGVSVHLAAGTHTLTLRVPAGVQIGGAALTTVNIPASMIAWGVSTSDKVAGIVPADTARKVKSYLRYEGYPESSTLRPRIRLRNVSNEPVNGFSVRYYFRGEDASQAGVDRYWPNYGPTFPAVHSESANTGYVEWSFAETIPVAGTVFGGDGPHFGLYNSGNVPWDASDDPSFVDPNSGLVANIDGFYEDVGVVVLDKDNNLIGGSCAEMEDPVSLETKVRVLAADVRGDKLASEIHFNVENTGNVSLKNFDVRYYFFVEEGLAPDYELDDKSECASASMENLGSGRWQVTVHCDKPLAAGKTWQNPVKVALHLPGWAEIWNANDDPSHDSLGTTVRETRGICVFDSTGYMLYGNTPVWALPAPDEVNPDSVYNVDFGYRAPGNSIPVIRTPEGLVVTMDNWSYVELSLVTAKGAPVKNIFAGTLAPGEQFVRVDWAGIDMNKTYLMFKVNGSIKSTKNLSLL